MKINLTHLTALQDKILHFSPVYICYGEAIILVLVEQVQMNPYGLKQLFKRFFF